MIAGNALSASNKMPELKGTDLTGGTVKPLNQTNKATVLVFLSVDCPISNSYAPELGRLKKDFSEKGISFAAVYPNSEESNKDVREHLKKYSIEFEGLRDPQHELVKASEVKVTPEAAVFVPGKGLVYHGRIDDRYAALGRARPEATKKDLREVLTAILEGGKFESHQKAVGCYISRVP